MKLSAGSIMMSYSYNNYTHTSYSQSFIPSSNIKSSVCQIIPSAFQPTSLMYKVQASSKLPYNILHNNYSDFVSNYYYYYHQHLYTFSLVKPLQ